MPKLRAITESAKAIQGGLLLAEKWKFYNRKIPGRGHIDFRPIFDALKKVGYDGYVTLEAILSRNPRQDLVAARKYMENMID
ncbi:MAG: hypothetical protein ABSA81_07240 [Candidatus Bathyarchaeia archaeon]